MDSQEDKQNQRIDEELLDGLAEDSLSLLRINLVVLTIFATVILFVVREMDVGYYNRFASSIYTITGLLFWAGSLTLSAYSYYVARRARLREVYKNRGRISDELLYLSNVSGVAFGSVTAIFCLIFGLIDGLHESGIEVIQPIGVILFSIFFVSIMFNIFAGIELVRKWVPNWVWDAFYGDWDGAVSKLRGLLNRD